MAQTKQIESTLTQLILHIPCLCFAQILGCQPTFEIKKKYIDGALVNLRPSVFRDITANGWVKLNGYFP